MRFFAIDRKEDTKFREQCYAVENLSDNESILHIGLVRPYFFLNSAEPDPVTIVSDVLYTGLHNRFDRFPNQRHSFRQLYHTGMVSHWPEQGVTYLDHKVHVDFSRRGFGEIQDFGIDIEKVVEAVPCSFSTLEKAAQDKVLPSKMDAGEMQSFRHFDRMIVAKYSDTLVRMNARNNIHVDNMGNHVSWGMNNYLTRAIRKVSRDENIPLLLHVMPKQEEDKITEPCVMTQKEAERVDHEFFFDIVPYTAIVQTPSAVLNNMQLKACVKHGKPRFTEDQMVRVAEWINNAQHIEFSRTMLWDGKNSFDRALKYA